MPEHIGSKLLSMYLDERVEEKQKESIDTHLSTCQDCKEDLSSLQLSKNLLKNVPEIIESEGFDFEFRQKLNTELVRRERIPAYQERLQDILEGLRPVILKPVPVLVKAVAVMTIAVFLTVTIFWNQISATPAIASVQGDVEIYNAKDKIWRSAEEGMRLNTGDVIKVAKASRINIKSRRYEIMLKENTEARAIDVEKPFRRSDAVSFGLDRGKMLVSTREKFKELEFKVESPLAEIKAIDTGFLVGVSPAEDDKTWIGVLNGRVEVDSKIELAGLPSKVVVDAGKATEIHPGSTPTSPRYLLENEWKEVQEIYRIGEEPQVALLVSMTPRRVRELLRPAGIYISAKKTEAMPTELVKIIAQINEAIIQKDREKHLEAIYSLEELIEKYPDPKYNIQFLFFITGYYYYVDEYQKATAVLDRIVEEYPISNLASLAICAKGLIYEENIKDPVNAALAYRTVLAEYPQSLEAEEAASGLKRLSSF